MAEEPAVEQSPQPETTQAPAPQVQTTPPATMELMAERTLAEISGDRREVARLEGIIAKAQGEVKQETPPAEGATEQPSAEETQTAEVQAAEEAQALAELDKQGLPTPKEPDRFRFKNAEDKAIALLARSKNIPLAEAARIVAGLPKPEEPKPPVQQDTQQQDPTITALETEVATIEQQLDEVGNEEGLFTPRVSALTKALSKANAKLESAISETKALARMQTLNQNERAQQTESEIRAAWETQKADTVKTYPAMADPESPLTLLANGLALKMQDPKHPDHAELFKPTAPRFVADKAAKLLKLSPTEVEKPAVSAPAKPVARPAPGSKGSSPPAPAMTDEQRIEAQRLRTERALTGGRTAHASGMIIL